MVGQRVSVESVDNSGQRAFDWTPISRRTAYAWPLSSILGVERGVTSCTATAGLLAKRGTDVDLVMCIEL